MNLISAIFRYIFTLGGLLGSKVDEASDNLAASPSGIKAAYRQERIQKEKEFRETRDAIATLISLRDQKTEELTKLQAEEDELDKMMQGAVSKAESDAANMEQHQAAFNRFFARKQEIDNRQAQLSEEVTNLDAQLETFKPKLTAMQQYIQSLTQKEAEAIADITAGQQIVQLNERLSGLQTGSPQNAQLAAIERARQKIKGKVKLSSELAGTDVNNQDQAYASAGTNTEASEAFEAMKARMKAKKASADAPVSERQL